MVSGDTKAQRLHGGQVSDLVTNSLKDDAGPTFVPGEQVRQFARVIRTLPPVQARQVHPVCDREVVERGQQVVLEGIPQPQLGGSAATEEQPHVQAVPALGGGRKAKQLTWVEVVEDASVAPYFGVVELVDDDDSVGPPGYW